MIYLTTLMTIAFLIFNWFISEKDFMYPSLLFVLVFLIAELFCIIFQNAYAIEFNSKTFVVLLIGFSIFTLIAWLINHRKPKISQGEIQDIRKIKVSPWISWGLVVLQIITIAAFIVYLRRLSFAYDQTERSLNQMINLYDTMTKFWVDQYVKLNVPIPLVFRVLNPIVGAASYMALYILINNFFAEGKISLSLLCSVLLNCFLIILNGSRSPLLRILTMAVILVYIFGMKSGRIRKEDSLKNFLKLLLILIVFGLLMILLLKIMRPKVKIGNIGGYLFTYIGAPLLNLNNWLAGYDGSIQSPFFGSQTFASIYKYVGKWTGNRDLQLYGTINVFAHSTNGIETGNVYTMFYCLIYDFSYLGPIIGTVVMSFYYCKTYLSSLVQDSREFDFKIFMYSYLFNDLLMSFFSCRFFETIISPDFLKFFIFSYLLYLIFIRFNTFERILKFVKNKG